MTHIDEFFPDSSRVIYNHSPLIEVICQIRFPTLLKIEASPPADFQERLRSTFPLFSRERPQFAGQVPPEIAELLNASNTQGVQYNFLSEDGAHRVSLSPESLAVTTANYNRWEDFRTLIEPALEALIDLYKPAFFTRIGLRYRNALDPSVLGWTDRPWADFISPNIAGELGRGTTPDVVVDEAHRAIRMRSKRTQEGVLLQHGLGKKLSDIGEVSVYLVDFDMYTDQKIEVNNAFPVLVRFNYRAGRAFRWCISDGLHERLEPQRIDNVEPR